MNTSVSLHSPTHLLNMCMWPIQMDLIWFDLATLSSLYWPHSVDHCQCHNGPGTGHDFLWWCQVGGSEGELRARGSSVSKSRGLSEGDAYLGYEGNQKEPRGRHEAGLRLLHLNTCVLELRSYSPTDGPQKSTRLENDLTGICTNTQHKQPRFLIEPGLRAIS